MICATPHIIYVHAFEKLKYTKTCSLPWRKNIIIDKVTSHTLSQVKKIDTSSPMEIGMAAGTGGEETFEEGHGKKTSELTVQAVYTGTGAKGGWNGGKCTEILQQRLG